MPVIADGATRGESELRLAMAAEADRIESWARTWDSTYRALAQRWSGWNSALVAAAALLAAGAGATGLGNVWSGSLGPRQRRLGRSGPAAAPSPGMPPMADGPDSRPVYKLRSPGR